MWKQSSRMVWSLLPPPTSQTRKQSRQGKPWMNSSRLHTRGSLPQRHTTLASSSSLHYFQHIYREINETQVKHQNPPVLPVQALQHVNSAGWEGVQVEGTRQVLPRDVLQLTRKVQRWHVPEKPPDKNHVHPAPSPNSRVEHKSNLTDYILYWPRRPLVVKLLMSSVMRKAEITLP